MAKYIQRFDLNVSQLEKSIKKKKNIHELLESRINLLMKELSSQGYEVLQSTFFHRSLLPTSIYIEVDDISNVADFVYPILKETKLPYQFKDTATRKQTYTYSSTSSAQTSDQSRKAS